MIIQNGVCFILCYNLVKFIYVNITFFCFIIKKRIYIIKTKIENALINLNINELLSEETKNDIRRELNELEESLEELGNHELLEAINKLDEKYSGLTQTLEIDDNDNNEEKKMDDLEKILINEVKSDIIRRANLLLAQNPEWGEFLNPLLEELEITNLSQDYLNEKLKILKEIQDDDTVERDYKEELKNLCIYLKNEVEEGLLDLPEEKKLEFIEVLKNNFNLLESVDTEINWEEKLYEFNEVCEKLQS
jgi:hypothetical protein